MLFPFLKLRISFEKCSFMRASTAILKPTNVIRYIYFIVVTYTFSRTHTDSAHWSWLLQSMLLNNFPSWDHGRRTKQFWCGQNTIYPINTHDLTILIFFSRKLCDLVCVSVRCMCTLNSYSFIFFTCPTFWY